MKKYLLVCVLALFASSAFAAMSDSQVKAKASAKAGKLSAIGLPFSLTPEQQASACGKQLATMNAKYVADFNACVDARNATMNNGTVLQIRNACVNEYGFAGIDPCLAGDPPAFVLAIKTKCESAAGKAAVEAKAAECKKAQAALAQACTDAQAQVASLSKERAAQAEKVKAAWGALQAAWGASQKEVNALNAINKGLADQNKILEANHCPADMKVPVVVTGDFKVPVNIDDPVVIPQPKFTPPLIN
jgi:hypothetical protein